MSYLPCELHCHSVHSDGDYTVCELQKKAIDDHLAIIALTDHNTFSGWDEIDDNIIPVIRGIELQTQVLTHLFLTLLTDTAIIL